MQNLVIHPIEISTIEPVLKNLPREGILKIMPNGFVYLDIADAYIHELFPLIKKNYLVEKPKYFDQDTAYIGAHVSVIYPEEAVVIDQEGIGNQHSFITDGLFAADILGKTYFALKVLAPSLIKIRTQNRLLEQLQFKRYLIDMHITVAIQT